MRKKIAAVLATALILCGCESGGLSESSLESSDDSSESALPYDIPEPGSKPENTRLEYMGIRELEKTEALEIYMRTFAAESGESSVVECEYIPLYKSADELSGRISSDRSPDLTDKLGTSCPYLASKNYYADLTAYLDVFAPQWEGYKEFIDYYAFGDAHYFYPETVTPAPTFLVYDKERFAELELADPEELFYKNKWTRAELLSAAIGFSSAADGAAIYGERIPEAFAAASGEAVIGKSESGQLVNNLGSEKISSALKFVREELAAAGLIGETSGSEIISAKTLAEGKAAFWLTNDTGLLKLSLDYPAMKTGIVPVPGETADKYYCAAKCEGFLVPRGAKNIAGAASFINCARIAAQSNEETGALAKMRSRLTPVPGEVFCLDGEPNITIREYLDAALDTEEKNVDMSGLDAALAEINAVNR